jgi:diguanylate cyclase (GGDEF)-like protein
MTNCPELKAKEIAERIREAVIDSGDNMCNHTVSLGISSYSGGDYNESVRNADKALYYAKEHGRNQVVLASEIE